MASKLVPAASSAAVPTPLLRTLNKEPEKLSKLLAATEAHHEAGRILGVVRAVASGALASAGGVAGGAVLAVAAGLASAWGWLLLPVGAPVFLAVLARTEKRAREKAVLEAGFPKSDARHLIALRRLQDRPDVNLSDREAVRAYLEEQETKR